VRVWAIAACVTLGLVGASSANPLDSPGTVYIDGSPCNLACQSYMEWSRKALKANQAAAKAMGAPNASAGKAAGMVSRKRVSKHVTPGSADPSSQRKTDDHQATLTAPPEPPPLPRPKPETAPLGGETREPEAALTKAPEPPLPKPGAEATPLKVETPEVPKEVPREVPRQRTPQEQVMAALAVAELMTNAETPRATGNHGADEAKSASAGDAKATPPGDTGALVALLISRPDVKSASALKGSNVAIDVTQTSAEENIRVALAAAGATETQLSAGDTSPLDRLISGDVQAAVLKLVSPEAAEAFPDIKGFKVLRVPLSPR
jgi:outer membrane biosynthesis protein TonB